MTCSPYVITLVCFFNFLNFPPSGKITYTSFFNLRLFPFRLIAGINLPFEISSKLQTIRNYRKGQTYFCPFFYPLFPTQICRYIFIRHVYTGIFCDKGCVIIFGSKSCGCCSKTYAKSKTSYYKIKLNLFCFIILPLNFISLKTQFN